MNISTHNMRALFINVLLALAMVAAIFAVIGGGWALVRYTGIFSFKKARKVLTIDETPITVENVKAIGELVTATFHDETVAIVGKRNETIRRRRAEGGDSTYVVIQRIPESQIDYWDQILVLIQKAHARIGIDFAELSQDAIKTDRSGKAVAVTLPVLKCLDFIMNPSDTEVFQESKGWDLEDLKKALAPVQTEFVAKMKADADLYEKARKGAEEVVTQLFRSAGYETVTVRFAPNQPAVLTLPSAGQ